MKARIRVDGEMIIVNDSIIQRYECGPLMTVMDDALVGRSVALFVFGSALVSVLTTAFVLARFALG